VIAVLKDINEPRYPNFLGIRKASKAVIPVWSDADLGIEPKTAQVKTTAYTQFADTTRQRRDIEGADEREKPKNWLIN